MKRNIFSHKNRVMLARQCKILGIICAYMHMHGDIQGFQRVNRDFSWHEGFQCGCHGFQCLIAP